MNTTLKRLVTTVSVILAAIALTLTSWVGAASAEGNPTVTIDKTVVYQNSTVGIFGSGFTGSGAERAEVYARVDSPTGTPIRIGKPFGGQPYAYAEGGGFQGYLKFTGLSTGRHKVYVQTYPASPDYTNTVPTTATPIETATIDIDYSSAQAKPVAFVTPNPAKPGQTVKVSFENIEQTSGDFNPEPIRVIGANGQVAHQTAQPVSLTAKYFSTFATTVSLPTDLAVGQYTIKAKMASGAYVEGAFRVSAGGASGGNGSLSGLFGSS